MMKLANNAKKIAFVIIAVCVARVIYVVACTNSK